VVLGVAELLTALREDRLRGHRLIRDIRLAEIAALPDVLPVTAVDAVPSVSELFDMFAPVAVEFVFADEA
jgi:hypothetical protein